MNLNKSIKHFILIVSIWWILKTGSDLPLNKRSSNDSLLKKISKIEENI